MRIALLTLTRDRLGYSQVCFASLCECAGTDYEHFVLDQGSTDGTPEWLLADESLDVTLLKENIGITRGLNLLLDEAVNPTEFDCVVRWDNDCQLLQPSTLRTVCEVAVDYGLIVAPRVKGLRNPPPSLGPIVLDDHVIDETTHLGGIFMAIPAKLFSEQGYRYDESFPLWSGDEAICTWYRAIGGRCGYLEGFAVNHYLTTDGQVEDNPAYFERRVLEGGPAR